MRLSSTARDLPGEPRDLPREQGEAGFIIVAVLWIIAALATFASCYAIYVGNSALAARVSSDRLQSDALISAGLELTALQLTGRTPDDPRPTGDFRFQLAGANVAVNFRTEGARVDLNAATKELLAGLFETLGAKPSDAAYYADRIIGWRKKNEGAGQNKEADAYKDAGLKYLPRQSPFQNVAELRFVLGLPPELVESAMPFLTIYNGIPQIDVMAAPPEVIQSLPHMTPDLAKTLLDTRRTSDPKAILSQLGQAKDSVSLDPRKANRVNMAIRLKDGRRVNAEAVILQNDKDTEPYAILAWSDDFDGVF
ncbi:putative general secretion pathway protein K [Methylocella tundrae]|uniref:Putative general secretion pathway protein K n=1 Tax=Methylocella tundrae TaxID=227605 RepID=A0A8B6M9H4_METTU|nr:type II secretion system protein GspK [Methylocella tundrae]VTZ51411.1 putative general secretion pathway protein K [Methylocella tundrae]